MEIMGKKMAELPPNGNGGGMVEQAAGSFGFLVATGEYVRLVVAVFAATLRVDISRLIARLDLGPEEAGLRRALRSSFLRRHLFFYVVKACRKMSQKISQGGSACSGPLF